MAYYDFKDLLRRTNSCKILRDKAFNIDKNPKYDGYQRGLASMVYKFFHKNTSRDAIKSEIMPNKQLAEELHKPVITKFEKRKLHSSFIDNIWGVDVADTKLISNFNKGFQILLCPIDIYSRHAWAASYQKRYYNY